MADMCVVFQPTLLMPIIQYIMPSKHKQLKKLLHVYWEVCPKYDENGKLKQEMILVVCVSPPLSACVLS
jgi:coatomer subunit beta